MHVLSVFKKTAQTSEYYFDGFERPNEILGIIHKSERDHEVKMVYFTDDYGQAGIIRIEEVAEACVSDIDRRKTAGHEIKMIENYSEVKRHKSVLSDPRTAEIMQLQQPINTNEQH